MYLRFVITQLDEDSGQLQGLFMAADALLKSGDLIGDDREQLRDIIIWFNVYLPVPHKAVMKGRATFWFIASAQGCIRRMWSLVHLLRLHGYLVEVHKCEHLHNIIYQNEFQVAAYPHRHDGKRTTK